MNGSSGKGNTESFLYQRKSQGLCLPEGICHSWVQAWLTQGTLLSQADTWAHLWLYLQKFGWFRRRYSACLQLFTAWEKHTHEQCHSEIKVMVSGAFLGLLRDAAWHHPRASQTYLGHGKNCTRHFLKAVSCWQPKCQRVFPSSLKFMTLVWFVSSPFQILPSQPAHSNCKICPGPKEILFQDAPWPSQDEKPSISGSWELHPFMCNKCVHESSTEKKKKDWFGKIISCVIRNSSVSVTSDKS